MSNGVFVKLLLMIAVSAGWFESSGDNSGSGKSFTRQLGYVELTAGDKPNNTLSKLSRRR